MRCSRRIPRVSGGVGRGSRAPAPSFDKQFVRDYLNRSTGNKQAPAPALPDDVVERTQAKYLEAFRRLTGHELPGRDLNL